jgi:HD superfamily phosphohydrolase
MEIRDPVHGSIHINDEEVSIIHHNFFQRLRNIRQLGFSEFVFPGATHTRFIHSVGVMDVGSRAFDKLFKNTRFDSELERLKETFKLACLLHDIGHAPLSHTTEVVMPALSELKIPSYFLNEKDRKSDRRATHEDYTIKSIADSSFAESFSEVEKSFGVDRNAVADLIRGFTNNEAYFEYKGVNYFPILHQLVSSELDCDRMDYLLRDSYFCGVSYGGYDLDWLLDNLKVCILDKKAYLGISERAVVTFDDFLLSRYHMFVMVYFHYRAVCLEQLLNKYFNSASGEYSIPSSIEEYVEHDDHYLLKVLRMSENPYAKAILKNQIPPKVYESFNPKQLKVLDQAQEFLADQGIEYIRCSSKGRLSKYYREEDAFTIKVYRKVWGKESEEYFDIDDSTDLFEKFSESHEINRLHCNTEHLSDEHLKKLQEILSR